MPRPDVNFCAVLKRSGRVEAVLAAQTLTSGNHSGSVCPPASTPQETALMSTPKNLPQRLSHLYISRRDKCLDRCLDKCPAQK
jgi:hypothetical protein